MRETSEHAASIQLCHLSRDSPLSFCPHCYFMPLNKCKAVTCERVDAANACRQIGNSVTASCIRSSRIGDGLIDFSVGVMAVMYCPFTRLKNICAGIRRNRCSILNLFFLLSLRSLSQPFFHRPVWSYDSLFGRTNYDFQRCPVDGRDE